jgi:hypothetical protein
VKSCFTSFLAAAIFISQARADEFMPQIVSLTPANFASGISVNGAFKAVFSEDQDGYVVDFRLALDGATVSPTLVRSTNLRTLLTVTYSPPSLFAPGSTHTYDMTILDSHGNLSPLKCAFKTTYTPLPPGTLFIEAEDFNFNHGQTITDAPIGMTGPYAGGLFQDKGNGLGGLSCDGSDFGIDYSDGDNSNDVDTGFVNYRPQTPVEAAKRNGPSGFNRGAFDVQINHVVGWTDSSEWLNYTRTFPSSGHYKVYARIAHGGAGARRGGTLFQVIGDPTVCDQFVSVLGSFDAPWTGGWDTWPDAGTDQDALIPMKNSSGNVVELSFGELPRPLKTLRFQFAGDAGDFDYLAFVPVSPKLSFAKTQAGLSISFEGTLESSGSATGTFNAVTGATSPYNPSATPQQFFRAKW